jgi:hypothetical protein
MDFDYIYNAELEIISPVLKTSKLEWRAIYKGLHITFGLKDYNFRKLVVNKSLQFSNGTKIICELETKQKMDDDGKISPSVKLVFNVSKIIYPDGITINL